MSRFHGHFHISTTHMMLTRMPINIAGRRHPCALTAIAEAHLFSTEKDKRTINGALKEFITVRRGSKEGGGGSSQGFRRISRSRGRMRA